MVILLAAIILTSIARFGMSVALQAHAAQEELQRRWGTFTLRTVVLSRPKDLLAEYLRRYGKTVEDPRQLYPLVREIRLGKLNFRLVLDDESRKLNLNRLYSASGSDAVRKSLIELRQSTFAVRLRPHRNVSGKLFTRPFESWGHVYALESISSKLPVTDWIALNTQGVTCWGNGGVHYHLSSDHVLELVARWAVDPIIAGRLIDLRRRNPSLTLDALLNQLAIRQRDRSRLEGWLTDESTCFSLWIEAKGFSRFATELFVTEVAGSGSQKVYRFAW